MGMFDSVRFICPNCGKRIEAQSKGGECQLHTYESARVPYDVAIDAHIHHPCKCGKAYRIKPFHPAYVSLELLEITDHDGGEWLERGDNVLSDIATRES